MKSYAMATIAFAYLIISAIGIIASCVLLHDLLNLTVLIIIVIVSVLSTLLLFSIILSLATILEKQAYEIANEEVKKEEYITKTLSLITEKLEQGK